MWREPDDGRKALFRDHHLHPDWRRHQRREQVLVGLRYQRVVSRKSNNKVFHDQCGYWMWDKATGTICTRC